MSCEVLGCFVAWRRRTFNLVQLVPTLEQLEPEQNELLAVMPDDEL